MSFARSLALLILCSLLAGTSLCAIAALSAAPQYGGAYAALSVSETVPDRLLRERLNPLKEISSGEAFSESTQWALLDEFGSVSRIPLDEYPGRVSGFDPRNDGYAEKLRSLFVHGGKRYVFIPLAGKSAALEKRAALLLADIPHTLEYLGYKKPLELFFCLFAAAAAGFFILHYALKRPVPELFGLLLCLPAAAPLAFYGAAGFALAAVLPGLQALLREPLREWSVLIRSRAAAAPTIRDNPPLEKRRLFFRNVYGPFRLYWLLSPLFPAIFALILAFSDVPPLFGALVFLVYAGINFFSAWAFSAPGGSRGHIRFSPLPIMRRRSPAPGPVAFMLPFALASALAALLPPFFGVSAAAGLPAFLSAPDLADEADYLKHAEFQHTFSRRPLNGGGPAAYQSYILGADGLLLAAENPGSTGRSEIPENTPPFPLKHFMEFLQTAADGAVKTAPYPVRPAFSAAIRNLLPALFLLVLTVPYLPFRGVIKRNTETRFKKA